MVKSYIKFDEESGQLKFKGSTDENFLKMIGYFFAVKYKDNHFKATKKDYIEFSKTLANGIVAAFYSLVDAKENDPASSGHDGEAFFVNNLYVEEYRKKPNTEFTTVDLILHDNDTVDLSTSGYAAYQMTVVAFVVALKVFQRKFYNVKKARAMDIDEVYKEAEKVVDVFTDMLPLVGYNIEDFA